MPPRPDEDRRRDLLDQLESLMLGEGFAHLRVGALATRLHCSRSTLYKLAPSKTDLVHAVFQRFVDRAVDEAEREASALDATTDRVIKFCEIIGRWQSVGSAAFWRDARDTPQTAEVLSRERARGYRVIQRYLDEGIASGELRPHSTAFVAHIVWLAAGATRDPDLLDQLGLGVEEALEELGKLIVHGVSRQAPIAAATLR